MNNRLKELFLGMILISMYNAFSMDTDDGNTDSSPLDVNEKDDMGCTPLHHVMKYKDAKVEHVAFLIQQGADINIGDKYGRDPYHYSFNHTGWTPESEPLHNCNNKVVYFLHSEMLLLKLEDLAFKQRAGIKYWQRKKT
jgi:hypothetical protein